MGYIWVFLIVCSVIVAIYNGRIEEVTKAIIDNSKLAVEISISLIGIMAFWLGMVKLAEKAGIVDFLSKIIEPIMNFVFPEIPKSNRALGNIAMNISANALGITNAATPIGIKAMQDMQKLNKNKSIATNSMCTFLAINTAGFQIIPASVIAILVATGSTKPTEIVAPAMLITFICTIVAIIVSRVLEKFFPVENEDTKKC